MHAVQEPEHALGDRVHTGDHNRVGVADIEEVAGEGERVERRGARVRERVGLGGAEFATQHAAEVQVAELQVRRAAFAPELERAELAQPGADEDRHAGELALQPGVADGAVDRPQQPARRASGRVDAVAAVVDLVRVAGAEALVSERPQGGDTAAAGAQRVEHLVDVVADAGDGGYACDRPAHAAVSRRPRTRTALLPPNARPLFWTTRRSARRAAFGTQSTAHSGSVSTWLMVGGMKPSAIASAQAAEPSALAAPIVCPIIALIEIVGGGAPSNTPWIADASVTSLACVPVPWAETRSTSCARTPALPCASAMQRAMLSRLGATGWSASQLSA